MSTQEKTASPRERIILRAAQEIQDGMNVNLGIGLPTLLADHAADKQGVLLQSENGLMGIGPYPQAGDRRPGSDQRRQRDCHGGRGSVVLRQRGLVRDDPRGAHRPCDLGGMQVSQKGDMANWMIPGKMVKGMGGAIQPQYPPALIDSV